MTPQVRNEFIQIIGSRKARRVLEVGATSLPGTLLSIPNVVSAEFRVGINMDESQCDGKVVVKANAHDLPFKSNFFDLILCNSLLEHDFEFWLTIKEIKRVADKNALIVIGVPGFSNKNLVLPVHNFPGDFYRFSAQAMKKILEGMIEVHRIEVKEIMNPPRVIGWGIK